MEKKEYPLIVIGGGPGGLTAAIYALRGGLPCLVIEKAVAGGAMFLTELIENFPGFPGGIQGPELSQRMEQQAKSLGAEFHQDEVDTVELEGNLKVVKLASGEVVKGRALIVATGCSPNKLGIPGEDKFYGRGVSYCATCDGAFFKGAEVAVIGGGDAAVQEALMLAKMTRHVHIIHRRDQLRAIEALQDAAKEAGNISFHWNSVAEAVEGENQVVSLKILHKHSGEKRSLPVEGVFIYVGITPITGFIKHLVEMTPDGYIKAGEDTKTSVPGIFAVGDVRKKPTRQIASAVGDGCNAVKAVEDYLLGI